MRPEGVERAFLFTVDVDWIPGSEEGVLGLCDFCERLGLTATFLFAGRMAQEAPDAVREVVRRGHQVGTHGWAHGQLSAEHEENFGRAPRDTQRRWLHDSHEAVVTACGVSPTVFRAPNLQVGETTLALLEELAYRFDSSVPARRFSITYGRINRPRYYAAPLEPYHPSRGHLAERGDSPLIEVAPSSFFVPLNSSVMRVFGVAPLRWAVRRLASRTRTVVFYTHPSEFVPAERQRIPDINPARHKQGLGPQHYAPLERLVRDILALGYVSTDFTGLRV